MPTQSDVINVQSIASLKYATLVHADVLEMRGGCTPNNAGLINCFSELLAALEIQITKVDYTSATTISIYEQLLNLIDLTADPNVADDPYFQYPYSVVVNFIDGVQGPAGKSAYQVWLAAGNTGTVQDYLDSLVGPQGDDGTPVDYSLVISNQNIAKEAKDFWVETGRADELKVDTAPTDPTDVLRLADINGILPTADRNQQLFAKADNSREYYASQQMPRGQFISTNDELTRALTRGASSQAEVFNKFKRFAHGGDDSNPGALVPSNVIPIRADQTNSWNYNSGTNTINSTFNAGSIIGFYSNDKHDEYLHTVTLSSSGADNDNIGVVIAFFEDYNDLVPNHAYGLNPADFNWPIDVTSQYIPNQHSLILWRSRNTLTRQYFIAYNDGKLDSKIVANGTNLSGLYKAPISSNWSGKSVDVKVVRNGDVINTYTKQYSDAPGGIGDYAFNIALDLNSDPLLYKFKGEQSYGYAAYSQQNATYLNAYFSESSNVIYDLRNGDTYVFGADGYNVDPARNFFNEVGFERFLYNKFEGKEFYIEPDGTIITVNGQAGAEGKSAYQVWLDNGHAGTQTDFLNSLKGTAGTNGTNGTNGANGLNGWSPVFAIVSDGARRVYQVIDWTGGQGTKPAINKYVGATGFVTSISDAVDVRGTVGATGPAGAQGSPGTQGATGVAGPTGATGANGFNGWSPVFLITADGERRVLQIADWVGGSGTKPATGQFLGALGLTGDITQAVDIRGQRGLKGDTGSPGTDGDNGTGLTTGTGVPSTPGELPGDVYIRSTTSDIYLWDGDSWELASRLDNPDLVHRSGTETIAGNKTLTGGWAFQKPTSITDVTNGAALTVTGNGSALVVNGYSQFNGNVDYEANVQFANVSGLRGFQFYKTLDPVNYYQLVFEPTNNVFGSAYNNGSFKRFLTPDDLPISFARDNLVMALGDSMTANGTFVSVLQTQLGAGWTVSNLGLSGGLVYGMFARLSEVLNTTSKYLILRGGVNDIAQGRTAAAIISDIQAITTIAKAAGKYVVVLTISPFGGNAIYNTGSEAIRNTVNTAIKTSITDIDVVIDADLLLRDSVDATILNSAYDSGDHLHQNTSGYTLVANTVFANVTFTKDATAVLIKATKSISLDQDLSTFSTPVFKNVTVLNIIAVGTNITGNPSLLASTSALNNEAAVFKFNLAGQTVDFVKFKDYNDALLISIATGTTSGTSILNITPQNINVGGISIVAPSGYATNFFTALDNLAVVQFKVNQIGFISASGIGNATNSNNAQTQYSATLGVRSSRNIADSVTAVSSQNANSASTAAIHSFIWGSNIQIGNFNKSGLSIGSVAPSSNALLIIRGTTAPGTVSVTASGTTVTGVGTEFTNRFAVGDTITANGETHTISAIASDTSMTTDAWTAAFAGAYTIASKNVLIVKSNGDFQITKNSVQGGLWYSGTTAGSVAQTAVGTATTVLHGGTTPTYSAVVGSDLSPTIVIPSGATATTQTSGTNNTSLATTAFVTSAVSGAEIKPIRNITAATTILPTDYTINVTAGTFPQPLPTTTLASGQIINVANSGSGVVTITGTSIFGQTSIQLQPFSTLTVQYTGVSGTYIIL